MLCALIMAGGKGERFWPLSTDEKPKQFLKLLGEETMIQMTVKRMQKVVPIERIFIVTGQQYVNIVKQQLPTLPERNIIVETVGRNTAPCIALSAFIIQKYYKDSTIAVVPSDQLVADEESFTSIMMGAHKFVNVNTNAIVTLGVVPDRPETGYGYIKYDETFSTINDIDIFSVNSFKEKPTEEKANQYIKQGNYLWNCGMFIWKTSTILKLTKQYLKNTYEILEEITSTKEEEYNEALNIKYQKIESVSVDYGIMEYAKDIYVIPCEFGWDDIGTWHSLERYRAQDDHNNILVGDIKNLDGNNNIIIGNDKPIVIVGLHDIFVVENDNMIFIGKKEHIEAIKEIKKKVG